MTDIPLGMTRGPAYWLGLAAAPVFASMALVSGLSGSEAVLCGSAHAGSAVTGMPVMYALMAVFHLAPWLKLTSR
ncbi:MAG: hypothetical protein FJX11_25155 [Alphaproteobacteria bacterium]|nr:hypothetical protein [Alphaproteobacteria bacterium]